MSFLHQTTTYILYSSIYQTHTRYITYKIWNEEYIYKCKVTKKIPIAMVLVGIFLLLLPKYFLFRYIAYR